MLASTSELFRYIKRTYHGSSLGGTPSERRVDSAANIPVLQGIRSPECVVAGAEPSFRFPRAGTATISIAFEPLTRPRAPLQLYD